MDYSLKKRAKSRKRRVLRVRKKLKGTAEQPRMCVNKSNRHLFVQLIDDEKGCTLVSFGTLSKENKKSNFSQKSKEAAQHIGKKVAELAKEKSIERVVFDRGRYKFHGLLAELANAARASGLQF
ncbi:MAG: 50S ribosomal protein L18 [Chlamydiota bacterium]